MDKENRYIVAVDPGTGKTSLCVGLVEDGACKIVYYDEQPSGGVEESAVKNVQKCRKVIEPMIRKAEEETGLRISQIVCCQPKFPVTTQIRHLSASRDEETEITEEEILNAEDQVRKDFLGEAGGDMAIFHTVSQSWSDGEQIQIRRSDIVGRYSPVLEGDFLLLTGRRNHLNNLDNLFGQIERCCAIRKYASMEAIASVVLNRDQKEEGVALIDLGAGVTSVGIYEGGVLRHFDAIPFGGDDITRDISQECQISFRLAENIKKGFGYCTNSRMDTSDDKILQVDGSETEPAKLIPAKYLAEVITSRVKEIREAILYSIYTSGYKDALRGGLVLTGGGASLVGIARAFELESGYKVSIGLPLKRFSLACGNIRTCSAVTALGMVLMAREEGLNCGFLKEEEGAETEETAASEADQVPAGTAFPGQHPEENGAGQRPAQTPASKAAETSSGTLFTTEETGELSPARKKERKKEKQSSLGIWFSGISGKVEEFLKEEGDTGTLFEE